MGKKTLKIAMVAVVAAVAGYGIYQNQTKEVAMSELGMANVEALAAGESLGGYTIHSFKCPPPKDYKNQISCSRGGSEDCYPSDC